MTDGEGKTDDTTSPHSEVPGRSDAETDETPVPIGEVPGPADAAPATDGESATTSNTSPTTDGESATTSNTSPTTDGDTATTADTPPPADVLAKRSPLAWSDMVAVRRRRVREVAEELLVLPQGIDVGGRLRTITADGGVGPGEIRATDLALADLTAVWGVARHFELEASVSLLAKQPDATHEPIAQSASLAIRRDLVRRTAVALGGTASALIGQPGTAYGASALVIHRHRLDQYVTFELSGGAVGTRLPHAQLVEAAAHAAVLAREPEAIFGGWLGAGYAVPVYHHGNDPTSAMPLAPRPRLDLDLGAAVRLAEHWDLSAEIAIIDRGDLADPATRLPVIDGGFDQVQVILAVSRRFAAAPPPARGED